MSRALQRVGPIPLLDDPSYSHRCSRQGLAHPTILGVLSSPYCVFGVSRRAFLDKLVLTGSMKRNHNPILPWHYPLVPYIRRNRDPSLFNWQHVITLEKGRLPIACGPRLKIAVPPVRHHPLVTIGVSLRSGDRVGAQNEDPTRPNCFR